MSASEYIYFPLQRVSHETECPVPAQPPSLCTQLRDMTQNSGSSPLLTVMQSAWF